MKTHTYYIYTHTPKYALWTFHLSVSVFVSDGHQSVLFISHLQYGLVLCLIIWGGFLLPPACTFPFLVDIYVCFNCLLGDKKLLFWVRLQEDSMWFSFWKLQTIKNHVRSEILPSLQAKKIACHSLMVAGGRQKTLASETKDFITRRTQALQASCSHWFFLPPSRGRQCRAAQVDAAHMVICVSDDELSWGNILLKGLSGNNAQPLPQRETLSLLS